MIGTSGDRKLRYRHSRSPMGYSASGSRPGKYAHDPRPLVNAKDCRRTQEASEKARSRKPGWRTKLEALAAFDAIIASSHSVLSTIATRCYTFDKLPPEHSLLRATNVIESASTTERHRAVHAGARRTKTAGAWLIFILAEIRPQKARAASTATPVAQPGSREKVHRLKTKSPTCKLHR